MNWMTDYQVVFNTLPQAGICNQSIDPYLQSILTSYQVHVRFPSVKNCFYDIKTYFHVLPLWQIQWSRPSTRRTETWIIPEIVSSVPAQPKHRKIHTHVHVTKCGLYLRWLVLRWLSLNTGRHIHMFMQCTETLLGLPTDINHHIYTMSFTLRICCLELFWYSVTLILLNSALALDI